MADCRLIDANALISYLYDDSKHSFLKAPFMNCTADRADVKFLLLDAPTVTIPQWLSVKDKMPGLFVSVLGHMTDAGEFPSVRECYYVGNGFFFPALEEIHPVDFWCEIPEPPKEENDG